MAQSAKFLTSAQVMSSQFVSLSPVSESVLTAQSPEPASDPVSPSLSLHLPRSHSVSVSLSLSQKKQELNYIPAYALLHHLVGFIDHVCE